MFCFKLEVQTKEKSYFCQLMINMVKYFHTQSERGLFLNCKQYSNGLSSISVVSIEQRTLKWKVYTLWKISSLKLIHRNPPNCVLEQNLPSPTPGIKSAYEYANHWSKLKMEVKQGHSDEVVARKFFTSLGFWNSTLCSYKSTGSNLILESSFRNISKLY